MKKLPFSKAQKIKKRSEISRLFKTGQRWECPCFTVFYGQNAYGHDRLGVIVSKRLGNAVERNKAKRAFREIYRNSARRAEKPYFDILIRPKPAAEANAGANQWSADERRGFFNKWQDEAKATIDLGSA